MARAKGLASRVHRKLRTCAAMMWVRTVRHNTALSSGVNRQMYPAASGMKRENIAMGIPNAALSTHDRLPSVASAGTKRAATPTHSYLLVRPGKDLRSFAESAIAASVADLHASKQRRAENYQSLFRFVRVRRRRESRRIRKTAENTLSACGNVPCFRHAQFNSAEDGICVDDRFRFDHVGVPQIEFDAAEDGLQTASAKLAAIQALLDAAEDGVLFESIARVELALGHRGHRFARLN